MSGRRLLSTVPIGMYRMKILGLTVSCHRSYLIFTQITIINIFFTPIFTISDARRFFKFAAPALNSIIVRKSRYTHHAINQSQTAGKRCCCLRFGPELFNHIVLNALTLFFNAYLGLVWLSNGYKFLSVQ